MTGHYSYEEACPQHANHKPDHNYANDDDGGGKPAAKDSVSNTPVGYTLAAEAGGFVIKKDWLLLDNQANTDVFVNEVRRGLSGQSRSVRWRKGGG
jgi:hypothetical protein